MTDKTAPQPPEACPYCGASLEGSDCYGSFDVDGHQTSQEAWCPECGEKWYEEYTYSGIYLCNPGQAEPPYETRG